MLSQETLDRYRRMPRPEKLQLVLRMIKEQTPYLFEGSAETVQRRFELLRRQNDVASRALLEGLAKAEQRER